MAKTRNPDYKAIHAAYYAVINTGMGLRQACRTYGCSIKALSSRLHNKVRLGVVHPGPEPVLSETQEWKIAEFVVKLNEIGYDFSRKEILDFGTDYAFTVGKRAVDKPLSRRWFYLFKKRHPKVKQGMCKHPDDLGAQISSPDLIIQHFKILGTTLETSDLLDKPHLIYSVDEKILSLKDEQREIICKKWSHSHRVNTSSQKCGQTTTVIGCGNAIGNALPPYFVFQGEHFDSSFLEESSPGAAGTAELSGRSNRDVFRSYLQNHFLKYVQPSDTAPVLLLFDGHKSHVTPALMDWASDLHLKLFPLPAHTSEFLQPLDLACFGPLQTDFTNDKLQLLTPNQREITNKDLCRLVCKSYQEHLNSSNLFNGFRRTGIQPFTGITAIDLDIFSPSVP